MNFNNILLFFICLLPKLLLSDEYDHKYKKGDEVIVWANVVGPYDNNQETYPYFSLPYCKKKDVIQYKDENMGEALLGYDYAKLGVSIKFLQNIEKSDICSLESIPKKDIKHFKYVISKNYWYDMALDGVSSRAPVGQEVAKGEESTFLYTHRDFIIYYNEDRIVGFKINATKPVEIKQDISIIKFTYGATFIENKEISFENRLFHSDNIDGEHKIRWLAVGNSFLIVLFLTGLVSVILMRTLHKDFARYGKGEDEADLGINGLDIIDDYGWKQVHGDIFRPPKFLMILSSLLGMGTQLLGVTVTVILFIIIGDLSFDRTKILTAGIFLYSFLAISSGYISIRFYTNYEGRNWTRCALLSASLFPFIVGIVSSVINTIAIVDGSSRAVPFLTILSLFCTWLFLSVPLTLLGGVLGKKSGSASHFPCRVNALPRPIPVKPWYFEPTILVLCSGILPFGSLFIELYYIFRSFWSYQSYYLYGFFLLSFILLLIVTSCCGLVITYIHINNEDHRWHWLSFLSGASTAIYIYIYAIYYFHAKTKMYGSFQTGFYFGNLLLSCIALSSVLGTVSYYTSSLFVRKIFSTVKID